MKAKLTGLCFAYLKRNFDCEAIENRVCDFAARNELKIGLYKNGWVMEQKIAEVFRVELVVRKTIEINGKDDAMELWENDAISDDVFYYELFPQIWEFFD